MNSLIETAKTAGAKTLRIKGTITNERLYNALSKRYDLKTFREEDLIEINLQ